MHSSNVYVLDKVPTMLQPALSTPFPPWCAARRKWYLIPGLCFYKLPEWNRISPQPYLYDMNGYRMFITKLSLGKMIKHRHKQLPLCTVPSTYCGCISDFNYGYFPLNWFYFKLKQSGLTFHSWEQYITLNIPIASPYLFNFFYIIPFANHLVWFLFF